MSDQTNDIAQSIAAAVKEATQHGGRAEVRINPNIQAPIPQHIANNLLEYLRRAQSTGMEAIAWCEAYQYVQQFATPPAQQGVPFNGLPAKK